MQFASSAPSSNLFIGNLPAEIDDATLQGIFGAYGQIKSFKLLPTSARGQGNAILSFATVEEAAWLVANLNGNIPQGLQTPVTVSFKQDNRQGGGMGDGAMGGGAWGGAATMGAGALGCGAWGGAAMAGGAAPNLMGGGPNLAAMACGAMGGGAMGGAAAPSPSVFIGDLPVDCTDMTIQSIFGAYGTVASHKLLAPGTSGKLACIVTFGTVDEAQWVVDNLNRNIPQGLAEPIVARFKSQGAGKGGKGGDAGFAGGGFGGPPVLTSFGPATGCGGNMCGGGKGFGGGGKGEPGATLFIGDLPMGIDDNTLVAVFGQYGTIGSHRILPPGSTGAAAIVSFNSVAEATWCVENLDQQIPQGLTTPIKCRFKTPNAAKAAGKGAPY